MPGPDPISQTRVRLGALTQMARAGGTPSAYDLARAIMPVMELCLEIGIESGRGQAARVDARRRQAAEEARLRAEWGPGSVEPDELLTARPSPARPGRGRGAPRL
jgi:hypothetical protein